jgi:hypothetical protein
MVQFSRRRVGCLASGDGWVLGPVLTLRFFNVFEAGEFRRQRKSAEVLCPAPSEKIYQVLVLFR